MRATPEGVARSSLEACFERNPRWGCFEGKFRFAGPLSSDGRLRLTEHKKSGRQAESADLAAILIAAENLLQQRP